MNMRSIIAPVPDSLALPRRSTTQKALDWLRARTPFLLVVILPTLLVGAYYYLVAADQYESEAHFIIRGADSAPTVNTGVGQFLGLAGASQSQSEAASVSDYLKSHDAVSALQSSANLVERFTRPEADIFSRLRTDHLSPERLLKYYQSKVSVHFDHDTGITSLQVRAFRADDAYDILQRLLSLGELRVNALNQRSYSDSVAAARVQLTEAETEVSNIQARMTSFRQAHSDVDPQVSGDAQIKLASEVNMNLIAARTQLNTMGALINHNSPQYIALARQVRSLESEAATQAQVSADTSAGSIATSLGGYEDLRVRQEFAAKRYEAAAANLEHAREQAQRQQLYLVRIVDANHPVKALLPERGRIVLTVFLALMLTYAIGWLIAAGMKEHAS